MTKLIRKLWKDEEGATMVEYGLMVALIAIVAMVGARALGVSVDSVFNSASTAITPAA